MSYRSRVYNHRNAHGPQMKSEQPFFSHLHADTGSAGGGFFLSAIGAGVQRKVSDVQRLSTPLEDELLGTNDARMLKDKEIQTKPMV